MQFEISAHPISTMEISKNFVRRGELSEVTGTLSETISTTNDSARNDSITNVTRSPISGGSTNVSTASAAITKQGMMIL